MMMKMMNISATFPSFSPHPLLSIHTLNKTTTKLFDGFFFFFSPDIITFKVKFHCEGINYLSFAWLIIQHLLLYWHLVTMCFFCVCLNRSHRSNHTAWNQHGVTGCRRQSSVSHTQGCWGKSCFGEHWRRLQNFIGSILVPLPWPCCRHVDSDVRERLAR